MCGIYGCVKNPKNKIKIKELLLQALNLLKNRGYDSFGVFLNDTSNNYILEKLGIDGKIIEHQETKDIFKYIENILETTNKNYTIGFGHTRWATHGGKTDENAHPHQSKCGKFILVHNGIISNYELLKKKYLKNTSLKSQTDSEVLVNLISIFYEKYDLPFLEILKKIETELIGSWACIIYNIDEPQKLYFIKNGSPLLLSKTNDLVMISSETTGFLNLSEEYILLRDNSMGYIENNNIFIEGEYKTMKIHKNNNLDLQLSNKYSHWMRKEIDDQIDMNVLFDPITSLKRINEYTVNLDLEFIKECKYLFIIACGSSYFAGAIASNYFRFTKAFEFVNVIEAGEFTKTHLECIENPEKDLLILIISQSGETCDLNNCINICREYSSNRKNLIKNNNLNEDPKEYLLNQKINLISNENDEIKIIGMINVIDSLLSRRTISNIYTNVGRENAVASTKSNSGQIISCLLLSIYKAQLNNKLENSLQLKFFNDLNKLHIDIQNTILLEPKIKIIAEKINNILLQSNENSMYLLGLHELKYACDEGSLKLKEISYIHAEAFHVLNLKHGPFALLKQNAIVVICYKNKNHVIKSCIQEIKSRNGIVFEISQDTENEDSDFNLTIPINKTFIGLLTIIVFQLLSYHIGLLRNNNIDYPKNLCKTSTVD